MNETTLDIRVGDKVRFSEEGIKRYKEYKEKTITDFVLPDDPLTTYVVKEVYKGETIVLITVSGLDMSFNEQVFEKVNDA